MRAAERRTRPRPGRVRDRLSKRIALVAVAALALVLAACTPPGTWPTYGGDSAHDGVDLTDNLNPLTSAWTAPLDGAAVYAKPIVADGRVFVATEKDDVFALDAHDGHVLWERNVGSPLNDVVANAGCGDIDPLGITSTPVIDLGTNTLYVVAEVSNGATPPSVHHQLFGLDPYTGTVVRTADADPPLPAGENPINLLQRASLTLADQRVYVGFGGNAGDCGNYHGWVVGVPEQAGAPNVSFEATPNSAGGAVWEPGGPAADSSGDVYVTTGNSTPLPGTPDPGRYAESALKLGPQLGTPLATFQDPLAGGDADLGSDAPSLLPNGDLFAVGKTDVGYLLAQPNLTEVAAITGVCAGTAPEGANAFDFGLDALYVPCRGGGLQQVKLAGDVTGWRAGSVNGPPIIVRGKLWAVQYPSGTIQQLDPATGAVLQTLQAGAVPTFTSPSAALGLLLVGTDDGVAAFAGPGGPPPPAPPPPSS